MFYRMSRAAYDEQRPEDTPPGYPLMLNRHGCEVLYKGTDTAYLMAALQTHTVPEGAERVAESWAEFYEHLTEQDTEARDAIFRVWVEVENEDGLARHKMSVARANERGHKAKAGQRPGADFVAGDVGPPALPDEAVEGIVSTPVLPMKQRGSDELAAQEALDEVAG